MHNLTTQDITEIQKLIEKDVFLAADQKELDKRRKDYEEIQRKEDERIQKEREAEIEALSLTPQYKKIKELIPIVQKLWDEYTDDQADWIGNYSKFDGYDAPTHLSFNIKIYDVNLPDGVQDKIDELNLQDASNSEFDHFMTDSAEFFIEELKEAYDFIGEVYGEGRSGGWLVVEVTTINPEDMDAVFEAFDQHSPDDEDWFTKKGMQDAYSILKNMKRDLEKRIKAYYEIEKKVELGKKDVTKTLSSKEFWDNFFEAHEGTPEEKEVKTE